VYKAPGEYVKVSTSVSYFSLALLLLLTGCVTTPDEQAAVTSESKKPAFVVVNVLSKEFYDDCHIKGSIQLDYDAVMDYAAKNWDKESTEIVIYCSNFMCSASGEVRNQLRAAGYKKVRAYEGGTAEAHAKGLPMVGPCKEGYLKQAEKPAGAVEHSPEDVIEIDELKKLLQEHKLI
jgi:rhodanese-related sulfurtransferase